MQVISEWSRESPRLPPGRQGTAGSTQQCTHRPPGALEGQPRMRASSRAPAGSSTGRGQAEQPSTTRRQPGTWPARSPFVGLRSQDGSGAGLKIAARGGDPDGACSRPRAPRTSVSEVTEAPVSPPRGLCLVARGREGPQVSPRSHPKNGSRDVVYFPATESSSTLGPGHPGQAIGLVCVVHQNSSDERGAPPAKS